MPALLADGMVLQREQPITLWGRADAGEQVTVRFLKKTYTTTADAAGAWSMGLPPQKAGGPYTLTINNMELKDVLIGDVYICSGQSNMELPIARVTDRFAEETATYSNPMIRHFKVPLAYDFHSPRQEVAASASWQTLTPEKAPAFSALAYFFAKNMFEKNKVPVGLINSSVGGSPIEAWTSEEALKAFPKYANEKKLYESDEYIAQIRKTETQRRNLWHAVLYRQDAGLHETPARHSPDYDDSAWSVTDLFDNAWSTNGLNPVNGSFWFRKEATIDRESAGQEAVLRLGCVVDADSVFVNGTFIGTTSYQYPPRIYRIPAGILKEGKNNVTVRLISYAGRPGFVKEKPYKMMVGNREYSLEGRWKYRLGTEMPALPGETFFQYKPAGLYNAMIAPLCRYAAKGVVWYQGESNTGRHNEYYEQMKALVADWRGAWNLPSLPFVLVELAGFGAPSDTYMQAQWAAFRAEQRRAAADIPHTGLAPALDLGEWNDIHPLDKKTLGERVAAEMEKLRTLNK